MVELINPEEELEQLEMEMDNNTEMGMGTEEWIIMTLISVGGFIKCM